MPPFLSDEWIAAAKLVQEDLGDAIPTPATPARINLRVTGPPDGEGDIHAHLDTSEGFAFAAGLLETADVTMTMPFDTARAVLVEGNQQAGMQAFMAGQLKVEGDMMKVMTLQSSMGGPDAAAFRHRLASITD